MINSKQKKSNRKGTEKRKKKNLFFCIDFVFFFTVCVSICSPLYKSFSLCFIGREKRKMKKNTKSLLFSLSLLLVCWCLLQVYGGCGRGRMRTEARQNLSNKAMAEGAGEEKKKFSIWDLPDVPMGQLPPHLELQRSRVSCNKDAPIHIESIQYSGAYASMGIDNSSGLDRFSNNFRVEVVRLNEDDMELDMIVIDAAIANSFRRILIAELPTMAIEKVLIAKKTSIIQDEVLAHRLGLVPIRVDPRLFDYLSENDQPNEKNTIVFKLHVQCKRGDKNI